MNNEIEQEVAKCLDVLKKGGIILYPTDTIWGIGCDATNESAVSRIYKLKKRSQSKSMVMLLDSEAELLNYVSFVPEKALQIIRSAERPTTIVYNKGQNTAKNLLSSNGSIAIRIVKNDFCQQLIHQLGKPLVSTSANISNEPAPANFNEITSMVLQGVDYVVNLQSEHSHLTAPSTIIRMDDNGQITIIRS